LPRILRATKSKGFSLIEILIVIALLALITAVGIPSINNAFRTSKESFGRKMAITLREARDRAMLTDKLVRLRIDFENQEYWLEEAPSSYLLPKPPERGLSEREQEARNKKEEGSFRLLKEITQEKIKMPPGLKIIEVISPRSKLPIKEGIADVFFYNNGSTDGAAIHLEDDENVKQSLKLHPVTGHSKLELGYEEGKL
jgi:prepilin-type N-terminal cleavage/methylation domain-containing protein